MGPRTRERTDPFITLAGLAEYMAATDASQRARIVTCFKYPEPEGYAQGDYYSAAREGIRAYHAANNDAGVLFLAAERLERLFTAASTAEATKLESNIRVLRSYNSLFRDRRFVPAAH